MEAKFKVINTVISELEKGYVIEVGILGEQASSIHKVENEKGELVMPKQPLTNAFIGAVHEYGSISRNIPERSFLRTPLASRVPLLIKANVDTLVQYLATGRFKKWLEGMAIKAENVVREAFHTSGWGSWKDLKPATIRRRKKGKNGGSPLPLLDTGQLSDSITSRVVTNED